MRALWAICLAAACGSTAAPGPKNTASETPEVREPAEPEPAPSDRRDVERAIGLLTEMAEAAATASGMCPEMGDQLMAIAAPGRELFLRLDTISRDPERSAVLDARRDRLEQVMAALFEQIGDCGADPGVRSAMEALAP